MMDVQDRQNPDISSRYDVYVSYSRQDYQWVRDFVAKVEESGYNVCWNNSSFEDEFWISKCACCVLIFSQYYLRQSEEWELFAAYKTDVGNNNKPSIRAGIDSKVIVCILISECVVPDCFNNAIILDWNDITQRKEIWKKFMKCLSLAQKKRLVKKTLASINMLTENGMEKSEDLSLKNEDGSVNFTGNYQEVIGHGNKKSCEHSTKLHLEINESSSHMQVTEPDQSTDRVSILENAVKSNVLNKFVSDVKDLNANEDGSLNFPWTNRIYPHLISNNFIADEDLTQEDIESLTFKPEDIKTIMELTPSKHERRKKLIKHDYCLISRKDANVTHFSSQYEQMKLLNVLQDISDKFQNKAESSTCAITKRRYRRLIRRYNDCIMLALNGEKDEEKLNELPFVKDMITVDDTDGCKCYCCDLLLHSKRALDTHVQDCIKRTWQSILK